MKNFHSFFNSIMYDPSNGLTSIAATSTLVYLAAAPLLSPTNRARLKSTSHRGHCLNGLRSVARQAARDTRALMRCQFSLYDYTDRIQGRQRTLVQGSASSSVDFLTVILAFRDYCLSNLSTGRKDWFSLFQHQDLPSSS